MAIIFGRLFGRKLRRLKYVRVLDGARLFANNYNTGKLNVHKPHITFSSAARISGTYRNKHQTRSTARVISLCIYIIYVCVYVYTCKIYIDIILEGREEDSRVPGLITEHGRLNLYKFPVIITYRS